MNNLFVPKESEKHLNKLKRDNYLVLASGTHLFAISQKQDNIAMMLPCATDPAKEEDKIDSVAVTGEDIFYSFGTNLIKFQKKGWQGKQPITNLKGCKEGLIYIADEKACMVNDEDEIFTLKLPRPVNEAVSYGDDVIYTSKDGLYSSVDDKRLSHQIYQNLCVNEDKIYGTLWNKIYDVISEEKIAEREGEVTSLGTHLGKLHDLGDYERIYETESKKEVFKFVRSLDGKKYYKTGIVGVPHSTIWEYINE